MAFAAIIQKVPMFDHLARHQRIDNARLVHERIYRTNEPLYEQRAEATHFYILLDGEVAVLKDGLEVMRKVGTPVRYEFFGGLEIDFKELRQTTVRVVSDKARVAYMDASTYQRLMNTPHQPEAKTVSAGSMTQSIHSMAASHSGAPVSNPSDSGVKYKDLRKAARLGCGGFAAVYLVEHIADDIDPRKSCYALKTVSKGFVLSRGCKKALINERTCHFMAKSPFIAKLYDTYNTHRHVHFLIEPALGGDLQDVYVRHRLYGSEKHTRYYIGSMCFALHHLKEQGIVYRDMKPENVMIHATGRVKLIDFGMAKVLLEKTYTICGTPEFMAPEILKLVGYNHCIDWWALGILTHDLMSGHTPFEAPTPVATFQKVAKGLPDAKTYQMLHEIVPNRKACERFIRDMCDMKPERRLYMAGDMQAVQSHSWYLLFNWPSLKDQTMEPPHMPALNGLKDISCFAQHQADKAPEATYYNDYTGWDHDFDSLAEKSQAMTTASQTAGSFGLTGWGSMALGGMSGMGGMLGGMSGMTGMSALGSSMGGVLGGLERQASKMIGQASEIEGHHDSNMSMVSAASRPDLKLH
jgi:serine/threonine protein kinase